MEDSILPFWVQPYKIRRSTQILSFAVRQNWDLLNTGGEACYLFKRQARASAPFQVDSRRVSTITKVASSYSTDPDTGCLRFKLWGRNSDPVDEYPDIGVFTTTVAATGSTDVWESAIDKYTFISGWNEYAFDIYQDEVDSDGEPIEDAVYVVFNTPPMHTSSIATFTYGTINPLVKFEGMQPVRDTETGYYRSLWGFEQWLKSDARIRTKISPNQFLLAFPGTLTDFTITDSGLLRESRAAYWTTPPPYSPTAVEHDMVIRVATSQRFQIVNYTPIYIEDILVSQHFDLAEIDPRSSLYSVSIRTV